MIKKINIWQAVGLLTMIVFILWSLLPFIFAPYSPKEMFMPWGQMSPKHLLGTNDMGYDIFSELVYAARTTLLVGILSALISLVLGTAIGLVAGYSAGWISQALDVLINVFLMIPMLPMTIVLAAFWGAGNGSIILTISLLGWCSTARVVRARTKQLGTSPFVESLRILGIPEWRILVMHILPNLYETILAKYILTVASCMLTEATISFMGLGDITQVTWGGMINFAFKRGGFSRGALNWYLSPGICIILCVLSFYLINEYFEQRANRVQGEMGSGG